MRRFHPAVIVLVLALTATGLLTVYSAGGVRFLVRQLLFLPAAAAAFVAILFIPRRFLYGLAEAIYGLALIALIAVLFAGTGPGSHRWFALGPISIQPSEFAKLATVIMLAKHLSIQRSARFRPKDLVVPVLIVALPAALVAIEPDLSTAVIFIAVLAAMLYWAGARPLHILLLFSPGFAFVAGFSIYIWIPFFIILAVVLFLRTTLVGAFAALGVNLLFGLLSPLVFRALKDYQQTRIRSFFAPWFDPHGIGWNAVQSQIAIGSGRLLGKGYLHGSQNRLGFLPNRHTDFIFSVLAEELGLIGCLVVLGLFLWLLRRFLATARSTRDQFGSAVCVGCAAVIGYQVFVNVAMLLGLLPITGIALPFISYGGSSLVLNFMLAGLVLNVATHAD